MLLTISDATGKTIFATATLAVKFVKNSDKIPTMKTTTICGKASNTFICPFSQLETPDTLAPSARAKPPPVKYLRF